MKVIVYAICKNEEKFVDRWVDSMSEADEIYVLDTGSTDKTVIKLNEYGVHTVSEVITPWRFDIARNKSLGLVPNDVDICVCTDLDEVFVPGWRKVLEEVWNSDTTIASYNYNWSFDVLGNPAVNYYIQKIHSRNDYMWSHPVHEVLTYQGKNEHAVVTDRITLNHYPDSEKSRGGYLTLLELSVKENPNDDRNMHYLGREYMYYKKWNECIDTLICHLKLPTAVWKDERSASMRFISRCYRNLSRFDEAKMWLDKAIREAPYLRDPFVERALLEYQLEDWLEVKKYCELALGITTKEKTYINEPFCWDYTVYDLLSLAHYKFGEKEKALFYINKALEMDPSESRLLDNKKFIQQL